MKKWLGKLKPKATNPANEEAQRQIIDKIFTLIKVNGVGITQSAGGVVTWSYEVLPTGMLVGVMNDGVTVLRISFGLKDIKAVKETPYGVILYLAKPTEVVNPAGHRSEDSEWPLIINWGQEPNLKVEILGYLSQLVKLNSATLL